MHCEHKTTQRGILHIQIQNKSLVLERKQKSPGVTAPLCVRTKKTPILGLFYSWPAVFEKHVGDLFVAALFLDENFAPVYDLRIY